MKPTLLSQQTLAGSDLTVDPAAMETVFFRLIGVGPKTLEDCACDLGKISKKIDEMPGWCIITGAGDMRKTLHELVDRFCDERENLNNG